MTDQVPERIRELIMMVFDRHQRHEVETYAPVFRMIEEDHENTLPVFKRCLTTGSEQARRETVRFIKALAEDINRSHIRFDRNPNGDGSWHPNSVANLLWLWNSLNVLDECGIPYVDEDNDILIATNLVEACYPYIERESLNYPRTDQHWRGLAALALTGVRPDDADRDIIIEYIAWSGSHTDIASAIRAAKDRGVLNVGTLRGIMEQQDSTASALVSGLL